MPDIRHDITDATPAAVVHAQHHNDLAEAVNAGVGTTGATGADGPEGPPGAAGPVGPMGPGVLTSPDGTRYALAVADDGTLSTTVVPQMVLTSVTPTVFNQGDGVVTFTVTGESFLTADVGGGYSSYLDAYNDGNGRYGVVAAGAPPAYDGTVSAVTADTVTINADLGYLVIGVHDLILWANDPNTYARLPGAITRNP